MGPCPVWRGGTDGDVFWLQILERQREKLEEEEILGSWEARNENWKVCGKWDALATGYNGLGAWEVFEAYSLARGADFGASGLFLFLSTSGIFFVVKSWKKEVSQWNCGSKLQECGRKSYYY